MLSKSGYAGRFHYLPPKEDFFNRAVDYSRFTPAKNLFWTRVNMACVLQPSSGRGDWADQPGAKVREAAPRS